jgi:TorA maturation chaperone TorD
MQQQKDFFIAYIQPCCELFSSKIISAEQVDFYKSVGRFGKAFFDIEAEALAMV